MSSVASDDAELARQVEDLREQQRAISGVLRAVARSEGIQPVLDEVIEACERLCRAEYGALYLLEQGLLHVAAHHTLAGGGEYDSEHPHALDRTTAAGRAAVERRPVHIPDIHADPEYSYGGPTEYYRSLIGVPIMVEDELIGVVVLSRREPAPFADEHIELVETFADQAAIAITNARLLEAVERQRTELARFVSPQVAELISSREGEQLLAGHRAYISCLFCDLRGFTAFAETAAPEELFDVLREYHAALGDLIPAYGGTLEHFAGDGVMVFFNDPLARRRPRASGRPARAGRTGPVRPAGRGLAKAWNGARARNRNRGRLRDDRSDRVRGPLRLRRTRAGREPRLAAQHARRPRARS